MNVYSIMRLLRANFKTIRTGFEKMARSGIHSNYCPIVA
jgi:hypothetical protein